MVFNLFVGDYNLYIREPNFVKMFMHLPEKCLTDMCAQVKCGIAKDGNDLPEINSFLLSPQPLLHKTFLFISPDYSLMLSGKEITYVRERECDCDTPRDIISTLLFSFPWFIT